jgi:hypothetical protein
MSNTRTESKRTLLENVFFRELTGHDEAWYARNSAVIFDNPALGIDWLKNAVKAGCLRVYDINEKGRCVIIAWAGVVEGRERELQIAAAIEHAPREKDGAELLNLFGDALARELKCASVTFQTLRPGLVVKMKKHGFRIAAAIMRKEIK